MTHSYQSPIEKRGVKMLLAVHAILRVLCALMIDALRILFINGVIVVVVIFWTIHVGQLRRVWGRTFPKKRKEKRR
ncbi:hypothetical protein [Lacticaseibacillus sharpeae]|nr:hypothetical protein [Lacticaseibacillus sharpeae]